MSENLGWKPAKLNKSGLSPLGHAVLVQPYEAPQKAEKSLIVLPDHVKAHQQTLDVMVKVIEVGPDCWPGETQRAFPGDIVLVAKFSGWMAGGDVTQDGETYRFVSDRDIFAKANVVEESDNG